MVPPAYFHQHNIHTRRLLLWRCDTWHTWINEIIVAYSHSKKSAFLGHVALCICRSILCGEIYNKKWTNLFRHAWPILKTPTLGTIFLDAVRIVWETPCTPLIGVHGSLYKQLSLLLSWYLYSVTARCCSSLHHPNILLLKLSCTCKDFHVFLQLSVDPVYCSSYYVCCSCGSVLPAESLLLLFACFKDQSLFCQI